MNPITVAKIRDVVSRAAWTFAQAFLAAFILPPVARIGSISTWEVAAFAAAAAGLAAVKSILVNVGPSAAVRAAEAETPAR